jgi:hypothetical protein
MELIMNSKLAIVIAASLFFFLFQAVVHAQDLERPTIELLEELTSLTKEVDEGKITSQNWQQQRSFVRRLIDETLNIEQRKSRIDSEGYHAAGKTALEVAYINLARSLEKHGITNEEPMDLVLGLLHTQLTTTIQSVKDYKPGDLLMVTGGEAPWLLRAISKKEYQKWETESIKDWSAYAPVNKQKFDEAFKELNALAATNVPRFKPNASNFSQHNAEEEALMKKQVPNVTIYKIGLAQATWEIQKNELDVIEKRFKTGYCWAKDPSDDIPYCVLYQVNIIQEYAGGGKYGPSKAVLLGKWVVGCP